MRMLALYVALPVVVLTMNACAQDLAVPAPPGETPLGDIGIYRVAYQSYGGQVVEMPPSWTGHFETVSGISYLTQQSVMGRDCILLHSPWHVPPGKVWVDYRLRLPDVRPIKLSFGVAMGPEFVIPGRSDGVTFSAYLVQGEREQELMRELQKTAQWHDFSFDLSEHAGREVTIRLQVEPGPANDASWDYSYFGDPKITAGESVQGRRELVRQLTSSKACRATEGVSLVALSNDPQHGVVPPNLLRARNSLEEAGPSYRFTYEGDDCRVVYTYRPETGTLDDLTVQVDDSAPFGPAVGGGVTALVGEGAEAKPIAARGGTLRSAETDQQRRQCTIVWEYHVGGQPLAVRWTFGIEGKALTVSAGCDEPRLSNLSLGHVGGAPLRRSIAIPYLVGNMDYLPAQQAFVCRYLDWTQSHASTCPQGEASYEPKTDGTRNPLIEVGYIAVSPQVGEVLPNIPNPPSPYRDVLGGRIMLDIWGHPDNTYAGDGAIMRDLKDNGVDHIAIIQHVWQCYGYDVKLPDHLPANASFGGDDGMKVFGQAANDCGYVWSLHENYIDLYPDAPSYDPTARVLRADGTPSPAWFNGGTGVQSFGLKCNRALGFAQQNSPEAHRRFGTTAAYLDVHTCVPPWHQLDHEAGQPMAAMALAKVKYDTELFQFERDSHGGPLFGEGANHFYWAGKCDGVEAQVAGGENHEPLLDFDLLRIHPQMVNHGMGYYERWFTGGYNHRWGVDTGTVEQVDKYRAQELAYGHAGFVGGAQINNLQWVAKEHHLMHPVQALYGTAKPTEIAYEVEGQFVPASVALAVGERWRQRISYDSGLRLWVNWAAEPWEVEGRTLPQWGFLALGPNTEVCTVLRDGRFADYAECPEYLFADARTSFNMPYLNGPKDVEPKLRQFEYLGDNRIRLTYEWVVGETLPTDCACFVHFLNPQAPRVDEIAFQQDHMTPKPTSQWQPGETVVDGPYEIAVPTDQAFHTYDVVIGLHKGDRMPLKGPDAGGNRILIARLEVQREGDRITGITLGDIAKSEARLAVPQADFTAHLNPAGTRVDFGKIATDGSVKVNLSERSLVVFPYPRDKDFSVTLDVRAISGDARLDLAQVKVRALAAGTQADLGEVPSSAEDGRVTFRVGKAGAGRFVVGW